MAKQKAAKKVAMKNGKQAPPKNTLTVEYKGICSFVWHKTLGAKAKSKEAEVWLVDVGSTGRARHYPCLTIATNQVAPGEPPDVVMAVPGIDAEFGGWDLSHSVIEIVSDLKPIPLQVKCRPLTSAELRKFPFVEPDNIDWLANLGEVTGTVAVKAVPPVMARVTNVRGRVTPLYVGREGDSRYTFKDGSIEIGTARRYMAWHFKQEIGYDKSVTIQISSAARGVREVEILAPKGQLDHQITIGNLCRCADDGTADHFYSFYDLVETSQRPIILNEPGGAVPGDEEHCGGNYVVDPEI